jgi:hypothetical protein
MNIRQDDHWGGDVVSYLGAEKFVVGRSAKRHKAISSKGLAWLSSFDCSRLVLLSFSSDRPASRKQHSLLSMKAFDRLCTGPRGAGAAFKSNSSLKVVDDQPEGGLHPELLQVGR